MFKPNKLVLLTLLLVSLTPSIVYQEALEIREKPSAMKIYDLLKIDLDDLSNSKFIDNWIIQDYLLLLHYSVVNSTYIYYVNVYDVKNQSLAFSREMFSSDAKLDIRVVGSSTGLLIYTKNTYIYIYLDSNNTLSILSGDFKEYIGVYSDRDLILIYNASTLMVFRGPYVYSVHRDYFELGEVASARYLPEKLIVVSTKRSGVVDVFVEEYSIVQNNLLKKTVRRLGSTSLFSDNYLSMGEEYFVAILDNGVYRVEYKNTSNIATYSVNSNSLFKAVKGNDVFLIYGGGQDGSLTYIVMKDLNESYALSVKYEDSLLKRVPDVNKLNVDRTGDIWILHYTDRNSSYLEFILMREGSTLFSAYRTIKGEVIEYSLVQPDYRVILFTTNYLNIERRTYLITFDSNYVKNLGFTVTMPRVTRIDDKLAVCFVSLEMGKPKLYVYMIPKLSLVLIRGIASTVHFVNQAGDKLSIVHYGGSSFAVIPPDYRYVKAVSRIGYYGGEELYEYLPFDSRVDELNYINTTSFSTLLIIYGDHTTRLTFRRISNDTQSFIIVHYRGVGYYYVPPGSYRVNIEVTGRGLEKTIDLELKEGFSNRINVDEIMLKNGIESVERLRGRAFIMIAVAFVSLVTVVFLLSLYKYVKRREE